MRNFHLDVLAEPLLSRFRQWRKTQAEPAGLPGLPDADRQKVLSKAGMTGYDIGHMTTDHPSPEKLLPSWLAAAGVDIGYVQAAQPAVLRDMQRMCSRCTDWKRCQTTLQQGEDYGTHCVYCRNAPTIDALIVGQPTGGPAHAS